MQKNKISAFKAITIAMWIVTLLSATVALGHLCALDENINVLDDQITKIRTEVNTLDKIAQKPPHPPAKVPRKKDKTHDKHNHR